MLIIIMKKLITILLLCFSHCAFAQMLQATTETKLKLQENEKLIKENKQIINMKLYENVVVLSDDNMKLYENVEMVLNKDINVSKSQEMRYFQDYNLRPSKCITEYFDIISNELNDELSLKMTHYFQINNMSIQCLTPEEMTYINNNNGKYPPNFSPQTISQKFKNVNEGTISLKDNWIRLDWSYVRP